MSILEQKLTALGESLPAPKAPVANYLGCKRHGSTLYVSARVSRTQGEVGSDLNVDEARAAAREAFLDILAIIKHEIGDLDLIAGSTRWSALFDQRQRSPNNPGSSMALRTCWSSYWVTPAAMRAPRPALPSYLLELQSNLSSRLLQPRCRATFPDCKRDD